MKKLPFLALIILFSMCKSASHTTKSVDSAKVTEADIKKIVEDETLTKAEEEKALDLPEYAQVRDDFRSVSERTKQQYLADLGAKADKYAVIIFTQGFQGENIVIKNDAKNFYNAMTMTDLSTGLAKSVRIDNTSDIIVEDTYTNGSLLLESKYLKSFKFIYLMKNNNNKETPFKVTYSNTLRPVR